MILGNTSLKMEISTSVSGKMRKCKDLENILSMIPERFILDSLPLVFFTVLARWLNFKAAVGLFFTKDIGKKEKNMDKEPIFIKMDKFDTMEIGETITSKVLGQ